MGWTGQLTILFWAWALSFAGLGHAAPKRTHPVRVVMTQAWNKGKVAVATVTDATSCVSLANQGREVSYFTQLQVVYLPEFWQVQLWQNGAGANSAADPCSGRIIDGILGGPQGTQRALDVVHNWGPNPDLHVSGLKIIAPKRFPRLRDMYHKAKQGAGKVWDEAEVALDRFLAEKCQEATERATLWMQKKFCKKRQPGGQTQGYDDYSFY
ncbi:MAG: hypothetical protein M1833_001828 [Piccolia ochrophora]|nr:MAG: hypothetical protein M1833_001828 [Piccolia ochrophora]